jgi:GntR family transcriptional repressor for pyruvate dehydrogenase complex
MSRHSTQMAQPLKTGRPNLSDPETGSVGLKEFQLVRPEDEGIVAEQVVEQIREMIRTGKLKPGDRLPSERELANRLGISRASLRHGLRFLAAIGILNSRRGSGTYIAHGPPVLKSESLQVLADLHRFSYADMFEARKVLECSLAELAAANAKPEHLALMAEEIAEMYAALDNPQEYLIHDIRFHRAVAAASGNQILSALMNMVSTAMYESRRETVERATDLKQSVELHRKIYKFIRARKTQEAAAAMNEHLNLAERAFTSEQETAAARKVIPSRREKG